MSHKGNDHWTDVIRECVHDMKSEDCCYCNPCERHDHKPKATCPLCSGTGEYAPALDFGDDLTDKEVADIESWGSLYWWRGIHHVWEMLNAAEKRLRAMQKARGL